MGMGMKKLWIWVGCALIAGMLAAGCGMGGGSSEIAAGRETVGSQEKVSEKETAETMAEAENWGTNDGLETAGSQEKVSEKETAETTAEDETRETAAALQFAAASVTEPSEEAASETEQLPVTPFYTLEEAGLSEKMSARLADMSLEEKVAQLFIVTPDALVGSDGALTAIDGDFAVAYDRTPVGGFIFMGGNLVNEEQTAAMLSAVQACSEERLQLPAFACVDEEGGTVARISGTGKFHVPTIGDMARIGKKNNPERAYEVGVKIGTYLHDLGFNVDFAPVADVITNPDNQVVKLRSFGDDPGVVANMAASVARGLASQRILGTYKHFPGHGATEADTHKGYAYSEKTKEQLFKSELVPFADGIARGIPFMMVAHISLPAVTGDDMPASLSPEIISGLLREEMGYDGIVITDALDMGAIIQEYSSAETAVRALRAGVDLLLMPEDFTAAYEGVLDAVRDGTLEEARIDESVIRILRVKLGLLASE